MLRLFFSSFSWKFSKSAPTSTVVALASLGEAAAAAVLFFFLLLFLSKSAFFSKSASRRFLHRQKAGRGTLAVLRPAFFFFFFFFFFPLSYTFGYSTGGTCSKCTTVTLARYTLNAPNTQLSRLTSCSNDVHCVHGRRTPHTNIYLPVWQFTLTTPTPNRQHEPSSFFPLTLLATGGTFFSHEQVAVTTYTRTAYTDGRTPDTNKHLSSIDADISKSKQTTIRILLQNNGMVTLLYHIYTNIFIVQHCQWTVHVT